MRSTIKRSLAALAASGALVIGTLAFAAPANAATSDNGGSLVNVDLNQPPTSDNQVADLASCANVAIIGVAACLHANL